MGVAPQIDGRRRKPVDNAELGGHQTIHIIDAIRNVRVAPVPVTATFTTPAASAGYFFAVVKVSAVGN